MTDQQLVENKAQRLTWDGPDTHVQVATTHARWWTQAWSTDVPGLVVVHDAAHDLWTLTHVSSGKAVAKHHVPMVKRMREAAQKLASLDWTLPEDQMTDDHYAAGQNLTAVLQPSLGVTPGTDQGVTSV